MYAYNGHYCVFKQYMPRKLIKHGIKLWVLYCLDTKYILRLKFYAGAIGKERGEVGKSFAVKYTKFKILYSLQQFLLHAHTYLSYFMIEAYMFFGVVRGHHKRYLNILRMDNNKARITLHIWMHYN